VLLAECEAFPIARGCPQRRVCTQNSGRRALRGITKKSCHLCPLATAAAEMPALTSPEHPCHLDRHNCYGRNDLSNMQRF